MTAPRTNYLKNTAPQLKEDFIASLKKIQIFSNLPENLMTQVFDYAKFIKLQNKERPIQQGMFDQEIYVLVDGTLDVFIQKDGGGETKIDVISQQFSLFGERCILGEPRGASIQSNGESLLVGIDLSSLPDILEALDNPEVKLEDKAYKQNQDMYAAFALVLVARLDRLIKDQYKLKHKLMVFHKYRATINHNVLLTRVFNEFCENQLPEELKSPQILLRILQSLQGGEMMGLLSEYPINTQKMYRELVRLHALGKIKNLNQTIHQLIKQITEQAKFLPQYKFTTQGRVEDLPEVIPLTVYLEKLYLEIVEQGILKKPLDKEDFLAGLLVDPLLNPFHLLAFLEEGDWIDCQFDKAHLMLLICKNCIYQVSAANSLIAKLVAELSKFNSIPRQNQETEDAALVREFTQLYNQAEKGLDQPTHAPKAPAEDKKPASQGNVEDLLASFGL